MAHTVQIQYSYNRCTNAINPWKARKIFYHAQACKCQISSLLWHHYLTNDSQTLQGQLAPPHAGDKLLTSERLNTVDRYSSNGYSVTEGHYSLQDISWMSIIVILIISSNIHNLLVIDSRNYRSTPCHRMAEGTLPVSNPYSCRLIKQTSRLQQLLTFTAM